MRLAASRKSNITFPEFIVLLIFLCAIGTADANAQAIGTITALGGEVAVQRGGRAVTPAIGVYVNQGDRVTTGHNGYISIVLSDRSEIDLGEDVVTVLTEHATAANGRSRTRINLFSGVLHSLVNVTATPADFQIYTPNAVAAARGTKFDTSYETGAARQGYGACRQFTDVAVYEGKVDVSSTSNPSAHTPLFAGYETTIACTGAPLVPAPIGVGSSHFHGPSPGSMAAPPPPSASSLPPITLPPVTTKPF